MSIPPLPLYRITLFYGPEALSIAPPRQSCVYNVKKRSWKGGVQIAVEMAESQLSEIRKAIAFEPWLRDMLAGVPDSARRDYAGRAADLFVQEICSLKLALALDTDIRQESGSLGSERFAGEVVRAALAQADHIKSKIVTELDLPLS